MTNLQDLLAVPPSGLIKQICAVNRKRVCGMLLALAAFALPDIAAAQTAPVADSIERLCVEPDRVKAEKALHAKWELQKPAKNEKEKLERAEELRQKLKSVPYEICPAWIRATFKSPQVADKVIMLREGVDHQKKVAEASFWKSYRWLQWYQWTLVFLGVVATALSALVAQTKSGDAAMQVAQAKRMRQFALLTVVATTLVTASGTMEAFYGLRGGTERYARVWGAMGALQSKIDDRLVLGESPDPALDPTKFFIEMSKERDNILQQAGEQWTSSLKNAGSNQR